MMRSLPRRLAARLSLLGVWPCLAAHWSRWVRGHVGAEHARPRRLSHCGDCGECSDRRAGAGSHCCRARSGRQPPHRGGAVRNDGRFAIDGLAAAKYQLTASKRGYSTAAYDEHGNYSSAVVTGEGQDTGSLVFKLMPGAVLRGVVTADGGDPVEGAQVMLFEKPAGSRAGSKNRADGYRHQRRHRSL